MRKHATADVDLPSRTLCGEPLFTYGALGVDGPRQPSARWIDNAAPDCKRCLRSIAAIYRKSAA